jgi:hypothetical protein
MLAQSSHENEHQDSVVETITSPVAGGSHGRTIHNASQNLRRAACCLTRTPTSVNPVGARTKLSALLIKFIYPRARAAECTFFGVLWVL